ncbi:MAG: methyltransferase domain-containing protein [Planctomycetota bacterium]
MTRPSWQLPKGVDRGTWDYIESPSIAGDYESFLDSHALFQLDTKIVREQLAELSTNFLSTDFENGPLIAADLGCGTGRIARHFGQASPSQDSSSEVRPPTTRWINIDLSQHMLRESIQLAGDDQINRVEIRGNLTELDFLRDASLHLCACLFSSIGMIRGRSNRRQLIRSANRSLKPGGQLILHVHNRYHSVFEPGGVRWLATSYMKSFRRAHEFGDRVYPYRGLPAMFLHIYSRRELLHNLRSGGFRKIDIRPISSDGSAQLPRATPMKWLRSGGFIAIATA